MAKLYISEYTQEASVGNALVPFPQEPAAVEQTPVVIGAGSLQSAAFAVGTHFIRVQADAICSIAFGAAPVATVNSKRLAAGATEYFGVTPGHMVAVITNT